MDQTIKKLRSMKFLRIKRNAFTYFKSSERLKQRARVQMKIHENSFGVYCEPEEKIRYFFKIFENKMKISNETLNIRLAADVTSIAHNYEILNFNFSFLDKVDQSVYSSKTRNKTSKESSVNANTVTGNFSLGIFHIEKECYELVDQSLKELLILIIELNQITIDQKLYKINWYLSGDLKFLAIVLVINQANSYHSCIFGDSHKNTFKNTINFNERKFDNIEIGKLGFKNKPIIDFITSENIIVDILHMFLRIADKLFDNSTTLIMHIRIRKRLI